MGVKENVATIRREIQEAVQQAGRHPEEITLVAVSKNVTPGAILEAYQEGQRDFGESRIQEAFPKIAQLPRAIRWHFIGRVQKNKVSQVVGHFVLIHSVDSVELAEKIATESQKKECVTSILLQVNTSGEASKAGLSVLEWEKVFAQVVKMQNIEVKGLMTIAPLNASEEQLRSCFSALKKMQGALSSQHSLPILSMGMSQDFTVAISEGATHLRIGSFIFK